MGNTATQNAQIKKLLAAGMTIDFINAHPEFKDGTWIDPQDVSKYLNAWKKDKAAKDAATAAKKKQEEFEASAPDILKNDPAWATMPQDMREIAVYNYQLQQSQDAEKARLLNVALETAASQADPYWREIIRIAQDELVRGIESLQTDAMTREETLVKRKQQIEEDLASGTTYLTDQQRADMKEQLKNYDTELTNIRETAAQKGITSSSIKTEADEMAYEKNKYTVESMQREGQKALRDLGVTAERDINTIEDEVNALKTALGQSTTGLVRESEKYLGTENLPTLPSFTTPLGDITGKLYEEKTVDIENRKNAIYNDLIGKSLNE